MACTEHAYLTFAIAGCGAEDVAGQEDALNAAIFTGIDVWGQERGALADSTSDA